MSTRMQSPSELLLRKICVNLTKPEEVKRILIEDVRGARELSADHCIQAMVKASVASLKEGKQKKRNKQRFETVAHLLLEYAVKVFDPDDISTKIRRKEILQKVMKQKMVTLIKRLVTIVKVEKNRYNQLKYFHLSPIIIATGFGLTDMTEMLLDAGFYPDIFYRLYPVVTSQMTEGNKEAFWELPRPHLQPKAVISSQVRESLMWMEDGPKMLRTLQLLGMDFYTIYTIISLCHASSQEIKNCMMEALDKHDVDIVKFFIDHGFNANSSVFVESFCPTLHYYTRILNLGYYLEPNWIDIVKVLIKGGANPSLKDSDGISAVDSLNTVDDAQVFTLVLALYHRLGYIPPAEIRRIIDTGTSIPPVFSDPVLEMNQIPTLQTLSRKTIRYEKGSKIKEHMEHLYYPQKLKDFILLNDINWNELNALLDDREFLDTLSLLFPY